MIASAAAEYRRYKALAEGALAQVPDAALCVPGPNNGNSLSIICWHVAGNFQSRFTDFLTSDGEKPWRQREEEFAARTVTRDELMAKWELGWTALFTALESIGSTPLSNTVTIRQQPLTIEEAVLRSLAHVSYHVGQIVYLAHVIRGGEWQYLTIPPGGSAAYNANPTFEKPGAHASRLAGPPA